MVSEWLLALWLCSFYCSFYQWASSLLSGLLKLQAREELDRPVSHTWNIEKVKSIYNPPRLLIWEALKRWTQWLRAWTLRETGSARTLCGLEDAPAGRLGWVWAALVRVWLPVTPRTVAHQAPLSMGFSRQEYGSEPVAICFSRDLPDAGIKPASTASSALLGGLFTTELPGRPLSCSHFSAKHCGLFSPGRDAIGRHFSFRLVVSASLLYLKRECAVAHFLEIYWKSARLSWFIMFLQAKHKPLHDSFPFYYTQAQCKLLWFAIRNQYLIFVPFWAHSS